MGSLKRNNSTQSWPVVFWSGEKSHESQGKLINSFMSNETEEKQLNSVGEAGQTHFAEQGIIRFIGKTWTGSED